jgi:hypothetical protein
MERKPSRMDDIGSVCAARTMGARDIAEQAAELSSFRAALRRPTDVPTSVATVSALRRARARRVVPGAVRLTVIGSSLCCQYGSPVRQQSTPRPRSRRSEQAARADSQATERNPASARSSVDRRMCAKLGGVVVGQPQGDVVTEVHDPSWFG